MVPGSMVLIGGDPGIGKSTLLLQVSQQLAAIGGKVLYVSGEESAEQIKLRAERLGSINTEFYLYAETDMNEISRAIEHISLIMLLLIPSNDDAARHHKCGRKRQPSKRNHCRITQNR